MEAAARAHALPGERLARPDHDGVAPHVGAQHVERLRRRDADPFALARREAPGPAVPAELAAACVDDGAIGPRQPVAGEEVAIVGAGKKAGLLALGSLRRRHAGRGCLRSRRRLALLAQREPAACQDARIDLGEHVRLILVGVAGACDQRSAAALDEAGVVAGGEPPGARAPRERDQLAEAERAVAAGARVWRLTAGVPGDEGPHDRLAKPLAEIERHVRQTSVVAGPTRGYDALARAAGAARVGAGRILPEA